MSRNSSINIKSRYSGTPGDFSWSGIHCCFLFTDVKEFLKIYCTYLYIMRNISLMKKMAREIGRKSGWRCHDLDLILDNDTFLKINFVVVGKWSADSSSQRKKKSVLVGEAVLHKMTSNVCFIYLFTNCLFGWLYFRFGSPAKTCFYWMLDNIVFGLFTNTPVSR